jgi:hypothetical protein
LRILLKVVVQDEELGSLHRSTVTWAPLGVRRTTSGGFIKCARRS